MNKLKTALRRKLKQHAILYRWLRTFRTRIRCFRLGLRYVDKCAYIAAGSSLSADIRIGPYAYVGPDAMICSGVSIGIYTMLGPRVTIVGKDHRFDLPGVPMIFSGRPVQLPTVIESDVWIGACSTLIAGVRVGRGSIVAAGSVITKDVPPFSIVSGVPARVLRKRFDGQEEETHLAMLDGPIVNGKYCADVFESIAAKKDA